MGPAQIEIGGDVAAEIQALDIEDIPELLGGYWQGLDLGSQFLGHGHAHKLNESLNRIRYGISTQTDPCLELSTALMTNSMPRRPSRTVG